MSKGDWRRPQQVDDKQFSDSWDRIFTRQPDGKDSGQDSSSESHSVNVRTTKDKQSSLT